MRQLQMEFTYDSLLKTGLALDKGQPPIFRRLKIPVAQASSTWQFGLAFANLGAGISRGVLAREPFWRSQTIR